MGALHYLTLLLVLPAIALADGNCPPQQIGSHCTCIPGPSFGALGTKVVCREIKDPAVLLQEIQNFRGYKIDVLLLLFMELPYLPAGLFLGTSVRELIIKDSILENLYSVMDDNSPFAGLEDSLEEFAVYATKEPSKWFYPDFSKFKHLKNIEIVQSRMNFVGAAFFSEIGGGSLETITVAYSGVNRIHPQAFPKLSNLREVNFRGNFLPYMVRTMFPDPALHLKKIDLSDNKLFTLPENMFDNMPALEFLELSRNEFRTFQNMPVYNQLKFFYIGQNPFECGCQLRPLKQLLLSSDIKYSDLEDVECIRPPGTKKRTLLKELSFEEFNCS